MESKNIWFSTPDIKSLNAEGRQRSCQSKQLILSYLILSYFVTLAIEESVSLGFINNSFAAFCTSHARAAAFA